MDDTRVEALRLAAEMRRVIARLALVDAPAADLARAADAAAAFADRLAGLPVRRWYDFAETSIAGGSPEAFFDQSPFVGRRNPLAAPFRLELVDDDPEWGRSVRGTGTFGAAYEGPPGCVHGGFVAALFDEVLGFAQALTDRPGMTGTLTVRYRAPTPLNRELVYRARIVRVEGRKIFAEADMHAADLLCGEAEGIFVAIDEKRFLELLGMRPEPE